MLLRREIYSESLKLNGEEHESTLSVASNYALSLKGLQHFEEAKSLMRKTMPVARRVLGTSNEIPLRLSWVYADALYTDPNATLDQVREAVMTLEETDSTARRMLGGAHPVATTIGTSLRDARDALRARETPSPPSGSA